MFWALNHFFSMEIYDWVPSGRAREYEVRRTGYAKGMELFPSWGRALVFLDPRKICQNLIPSEIEEVENR